MFLSLSFIDLLSLSRLTGSLLNARSGASKQKKQSLYPWSLPIIRRGETNIFRYNCLKYNSDQCFGSTEHICPHLGAQKKNPWGNDISAPATNRKRSWPGKDGRRSKGRSHEGAHHDSQSIRREGERAKCNQK